MPTTPKPKRCTVALRANTQQFGESLSKAVQTKGLAGQRWAITYELPSMKRDQAAAWCAFLSQLNGRAGRFYGHSPSALTNRGTSTGATVNGAGQTGYTLVMDGLTAGAIPFLTGDYLAWDAPSGWRELHKITADELATGTILYNEEGYGDDGYGYAECWPTIIPPIRESPADNATLIVSSASCVMRLIDDEQAAWDVETAMIYGIKFSAEEVWS